MATRRIEAEMAAPQSETSRRAYLVRVGSPACVGGRGCGPSAGLRGRRYLVRACVRQFCVCGPTPPGLLLSAGPSPVGRRQVTDRLSPPPTDLPAWAGVRVGRHVTAGAAK
jgi:hypothetical protein